MAEKSIEDIELEALSEEFKVKPPKAGKSNSKNVGTKLSAQDVKEQVKTAVNKKQVLVAYYREEEKIPVTISPFYAPYLSSIVKVQVNGIVVDVPADGKTYMINKTHAEHAIAKIKKVDSSIARQKRASSVQKNFETTPGELRI